jgi:hypothetical protein
MEDFDILTVNLHSTLHVKPHPNTISQLNTSRIGYNLLNTTKQGDNPVSSFFHNIENHFSQEINEAAGDIAEELGLDDFYSVHLLDYCYGDYTPGPVPNATLSSKSIHKNLTACSNRTAMYKFDPTQIIQEQLDKSGVNITLDDLNWPADIQKGINALHIVQTAAFILYCIAIGLIGLSLLFSLPAIFSAGRLAACVNVLVSILAFLAIGLASALITAVMVKGVSVVNKYGKEIGVEAHKGNKFLGITWAATGLMLIAMAWWCFETCLGHRKRAAPTYSKQG